jgi:hypothetical protein
MGGFAAAAAAQGLAVDGALAALHFETEPSEVLGDARGEGDEEDFAEMVAGVAAVAGVLNGGIYVC